MAVIDTSRLDESFEDSNGTLSGNTTNTAGSVNSVPTSRTISFTITSEPNGGSIFLNNQNTNYITPYTMNFEETELLTPKILTVVNGTNKSVETYIISSEVITTTTGTSSNSNSGVNNSNGNSSNGNNTGRRNSIGGGGGAGNGSEDPLDNRGAAFGIEGGGRDRNNAQQ
jgi:hypothetical protein